jgi:AsmA-like C-terminal region
VQVGQIPIHKIRADIRLDADEKQVRQPKIHITNGHANLAGGALEVNGWVDMNEHKLTLHTTLAKAQANKLTEQLFGHPGELSGTVDADVKFETEGNDYKDALANLTGNGVVTVRGGIVSRFGQLQTRLTQANLLHQGLFGFNLNNLLQSTVPVRTGRFKDLVSEFRLSKNVLYVDELTYNGDDMRLLGAGKANLTRNTLDIDIAGKIPRVTSSVFGSGTLGEMSKAMTIQKLMNKVTMHQLENLPSLPVLGDIASDKPRAFAFKINSPLDKPKSVGQSIEKSFHWLPSKPRASAHPLPGLVQSNQG